MTNKSEDESSSEQEEQLNSEESEEGNESSDEERGELDASSTDSDEADDDSADDNKYGTLNSKNKRDVANVCQEEQKSKQDAIAQHLMEQYKAKKGKQLFIRFPQKLPEDENIFQQKVHSLSELIVKAHKPRQKHARFCLVDFKSQIDRDAALKEIHTAAGKDSNLRGIVLNIPRTENLEFVQSLIEKKQMAYEKRKAKARLRKASKIAAVDKVRNYTSSVVIVNLPSSATIAEVRNLFPHAIDVQLKARKGKMKDNSVATVTLPSTMDARAAVKKKLSLAGNTLNIRFNTSLDKKQTRGDRKAPTAAPVTHTDVKKRKKGNTAEICSSSSKKPKLKQKAGKNIQQKK